MPHVGQTPNDAATTSRISSLAETPRTFAAWAIALCSWASTLIDVPIVLFFCLVMGVFLEQGMGAVGVGEFCHGWGGLVWTG